MPEKEMKKLIGRLRLEIVELHETIDKLITNYDGKVELLEKIIETKDEIISIKNSIIKSQETRIELLEINLGYLP